MIQVSRVIHPPMTPFPSRPLMIPFQAAGQYLSLPTSNRALDVLPEALPVLSRHWIPEFGDRARAVRLLPLIALRDPDEGIARTLAALIALRACYLRGLPLTLQTEGRSLSRRALLALRIARALTIPFDPEGPVARIKLARALDAIDNLTTEINRLALYQ